METAQKSTPGEQVIDASYSLLDQQLVDLDGRLVGKVDDLELTDPEFGDDETDDSRARTPVIVAILSGPGALAPRLGGRVGALMFGAWRRLHPEENPRPRRIPFEQVARLYDHVELAVSSDDLEEDRTHRWISERLISRLPGADRAAQ